MIEIVAQHNKFTLAWIIRYRSVRVGYIVETLGKYIVWRKRPKHFEIACRANTLQEAKQFVLSGGDKDG